MDKKEFIHAIDSFKPDKSLKQKIYNKITDNEKQNECIVYKEKINVIKKPVLICTACIIAVFIAVSAVMTVGGEQLRSMFAGEKITRDDNSDSIIINNDAVTDDQPQEDGVSVNIDSNYCDGWHLSIFYEVYATGEKLSLCDNLEGQVSIKVNGKPEDSKLTYSNEFYIYGSKPGTFSGELQITAHDPDVFQDSTSIEIVLTDFVGRNTVNRYYNSEKAEYEQLVCYKKALTASADFILNISEDENKQSYDVNETKEGFCLEKVIITPYLTQINISGSEYDQQKNILYTINVSDSTGKVLEMKHEQSWEGKWYDVAMKEATSIIIEIFRQGTNPQDSETICVFDVPIDKGYNIALAPVNSKIIYNPPISDVEEQISDRILNETDFVMPGQCSKELMRSCTVNIEDSCITDNIKSAGNLNYFITDDVQYINADGSFCEGFSGLIIDVTVYNNCLFSEYFQPGFELQDTLGGDWIKPVGVSDFDSASSIGEVDDLSFKVVFVVSNDNLKLPVMCTYGSDDDIYRVRVN
ncbi:MAG: hypothetical protein Q4F95_06960 [Oscillospiraceae bacterium]|nr:hypothetical protein [Oscillospiraceae bacterium]